VTSFGRTSGLVAIVRRSLAKAPEDRYPNAEALARALEQEPLSGMSPRSRTMAIAAAAVVVIAIAGIGVALWKRQSSVVTPGNDSARALAALPSENVSTRPAPTPPPPAANPTPAARGTSASAAVPDGPRATIKMVLTGSYPFEVRQNGRLVREASVSHEFSWPSDGRLTLYSEDYFLDKQIEVKLQRGGVMRESAPELGEVYFKGNESCLILHEGRSLNLYVKQDLPRMASGWHEFQFKCANGATPPPVKVLVSSGPRREIDVR